jgi:hypothetical protein
MNYKKLRVFGRGRRRLLEDEDDDWLGGGIGTTTQYHDYPASVTSSARHPFGLHSRGASGSVSALSSHHVPSAPSTPMHELIHYPAPLTPMHEYPAQSAQPQSPYLMGMRTASSGSIFHESVWPPPNDASRFVDPLVQGFSQVDLSNIVGDVMGSGATPSTHHVTYGSPVVAGSVGLHGRAPSQAGLLSFSQEDAAPMTTAAQPLSSPMHDSDADELRGVRAGSPVMEPPQTRLFVKNGEAPLSPASPTESERGFAAAQAQQSPGSPSGSPRWLNRQVRKD